MRPINRFVCACLLALVAAAAASLEAAGPDLKTYFPSDFTDQAYQKKAHTRVGTAWKRPESPPKPGSKTVVVATFLRDGSLLESRVHHASGSEAWDQSGVQAVKASAPLDPLPKGYSRTSVEIHFHFEYN